jgi:hypothetical protein
MLHTPAVAWRPKLILLVLGASLGLVPVAVALGPALAEEPVLTGARNESRPAIAHARAGAVLVWTLSRPSGLTDVYLRKGSNPRIKLNRTGTAFSGDVDPPWVVYQHILSGQSDIRFYRLDRHKHVAAPRGLNTERWELRPQISGNWILFQRDRAGLARTDLLLLNRRTGAKRLLATGVYDLDRDLVSGQVKGNWATWEKCTPVCNAYLYNIGARVTTKLPKPSGPDPVNVWAPAVTAKGVVYAAQRVNDCGDAVQIVRYRRSGDPATGTALLTLPAGIDADHLFARTKGDGSVQVHYTRVTCGDQEKTDIYRFVDPAPPG